MDGARRGEPVLYVTLSETEEELRAGAESHGWVLDGIEIRELTPQEDELDLDEQNTMFHPSEVELASITKLILEDVQRLKPTVWSLIRSPNCGSLPDLLSVIGARFSR